MIQDKIHTDTADSRVDMDMKQLANTATGNSFKKTSANMKKSVNIMKKIIQIALFTAIFILSACSSKKKPAPKPQPKQLFVLVYDISASNHQYGILNKEHLKTIYKLMGEKGGGRFYGLHIKAHSLQQDPLRINVPNMGVNEVSGNRYQRAQQKKGNEKHRNKFLKGEDNFVHTASALLQSKNKPFSDIEHAMDFVKQIIAQPIANKGWQIKVLIISDMINDLPPKNGYDRMEAVTLPVKAQVVVVRPNPVIELSRIFPETKVITAVSINDGIDILLQ